MKKYTIECNYSYKQRLNSSYCGNPRFYGVFNATDDGRRIAGKTARNAMAGYEIQNCRKNKPYNVTFHVTAAGNLIIDYIREV